MHYVDVKGDSFGNIFVLAGFKEKKTLPVRPEKSIYGRRYHLRGLTSKGAGIYGNEEDNRAVGYVLSAIEDAGIDSTMTDYDKVAAINQYLCEKLSYAEYAAVEGYPYEKNWLPFTDYCLLSNTAVCAGYAEAFQSMCCTLGIECWYVTGNVYESNGELIGYHAWNRVVLEGKGYSADGYRLPTEAEWEYAACAATTTPFHFGDYVHNSDANCYNAYGYNNDASGSWVNGSDAYLRRTVAVDQYPANAYGLYNMHGNVAEWVWDWYGGYGSGAAADPSGPESGNAKVIRGGG